MCLKIVMRSPCMSCRHQVAFGCISPPFPTFPHRSPNLRITRWAAVVYVGKPSGAGHGGTALDSTPRGEAVRGTTYGSFRLHDFRKALYISGAGQAPLIHTATDVHTDPRGLWTTGARILCCGHALITVYYSHMSADY